MALTLNVAFWVCFCAVGYNYAGYPIVLFLLAMLAQAKSDLAFLLTWNSRRRSATPNDREYHAGIFLIERSPMPDQGSRFSGSVAPLT
jgi:hypothetical protein